MKKSKEKGSALIITLILVFVLSVMGVSLMFLSQSETWSSFNYRLMTQSRYGAESGLNVAANFIMNSYTAPAATGTDLLSNYDTTHSPVQYNNAPVVLSSNPSVTSNYPVASVVTAFQNAMNTPGQITAGNTTVNYNATATLLSMGTVTTPSGVVTVQTWEVTADGSINGIKSGLEEVTAVMERQVTTANTYAAFAVAATCGALNFVGNASTNSYDSSALAGGVPVIGNYDGNVGSNGNLNENGNVTINGTMSTPRTGVGSCAAGNVDAWTNTGNATVTGGLVELPQTVSYTLPTIPAPPNNTNLNVNGGGKGCTQTISPGTYGGDISIQSNCTLILNPGVYNINSITEAGQAQVQIATDASGKVLGPVTLNITGANQTTPVDLSGGGFINSSYIAGDFMINYNGTGTIKLVGGSGAAGVVYAPNATVQLSGNADFYGSFIGATIQDNGNGTIHYDRSLQKNNNAVSNYQLDSFSWTRF